MLVPVLLGSLRTADALAFGLGLLRLAGGGLGGRGLGGRGLDGLGFGRCFDRRYWYNYRGGLTDSD